MAAGSKMAVFPISKPDVDSERYISILPYHNTSRVFGGKSTCVFLLPRSTPLQGIKFVSPESDRHEDGLLNTITRPLTASL